MSPAAVTYRLHNLYIRSDVSLDEPAVENQTADVEIRRGEPRTVSDEVPPGEVVVRLNLHDRVWYSATHDGGGYTLRFPNLCDFALSEDCSSITWHPLEAVDEGFIGMMLKGTVLSFALSLRGELLLHSSAVTIDGEAVAFAGLSGMGKSTAAALLCAGGAPLLADDALRVDLGSPIVCFRGASSLRLRESAASILDLFETRPRVGETPDGRLAIYPPSGESAVPLGAVVVPHPDREIERVSIEPILGAEAFWTMLRFGRVMGWQQQRRIQQQFFQISRLVRETKIMRARIPWTQPFTRQTANELRREIVGSVSHANG
jgi:hypothetical protein